MEIVGNKMCVVQMHAIRFSLFSRLMWVLGVYSEGAELLLRAFANLLAQIAENKLVKFQTLKTSEHSWKHVLYQIPLMWLNYVTLLNLCPIFTLFSFCLWKIPWTPVCLCFLSYISSSRHWQCWMAWILVLCWNLSWISNFVFM